ncbi:hypothetical protein JCM17960_19890 [Magnetospira thiophila]
MLSLGREITTTHGHYIDNLFIDGNGTIVVAELKRGRATRDIISQVLDYAAFVNRLDWPQVAQIYRTNMNAELDAAYHNMFAFPLDYSKKPEHRLLLVSESLAPNAFDTARYLIEGGTPLAVINFRYIELNGSKLLDLETVLGEIPGQHRMVQPLNTALVETGTGLSARIFASAAQRLPGIALKQGWPLKYRINKRTLPFVANHWPTNFSDCHLRIDDYWGGLNLTLVAKTESVPGLESFLIDHHPFWHDAFPAEKLDRPRSAFFEFNAKKPAPDSHDDQSIAALMERVEAMTGVMVPLVDRYFKEVHPDE